MRLPTLQTSSLLTFPPPCISWAWGWARNHPRIVPPPAFFTIALNFLVLAVAAGAAVAVTCPALSAAAAVDAIVAVAPKSISNFIRTLSGCDGGNRTRNIAERIPGILTY